MTWNFGFEMPYQKRLGSKHFLIYPFKLEISDLYTCYWFNLVILNFYVNCLYDKGDV